MNEKNLTEGWVSIYRSVWDHPMAHDAQYMWIWITLLLDAQYKPAQRDWCGKSIILERGQCITSVPRIMRLTGQSESVIRRCLKRMETDKQIVRQTSSLSSLITIRNYDDYQKSNRPNTDEKHSKHSQTSANNKENNVNNENNTLSSEKSDEDVDDKEYVPKHQITPKIVTRYHSLVKEMYPSAKPKFDTDLKYCDNLLDKYGEDVILKALKYVKTYNDGFWLEQIRSIKKLWRKPPGSSAYHDFDKWIDVFIDKSQSEKKPVEEKIFYD